MLRLWSSVLSIFLLVGVADAQTVSPDFKPTFDKGIAALKADRNDEGIACFKRCMELVPTDPISPYNVACGYSRKGELDPAFEYLDKAATLGFGNLNDPTGKSNIVAAGEDTDLENARKDPRWAKFVERMTTARADRDAAKKKGEEFAAKAAVYIPEEVAALAEMPVLVVLHDYGQTKDQMVAGRYKAIADELGYALIAPSGRILTGADPQAGMAWFDDAATYVKGPWQYEKSITESVTAFKKEHKVDKNRVYLIGEGVGGLVATSAAVGSPGLFKGAIAINAQLAAPLVAQKAPNAGKMGLRLWFLNDTALAQQGLPAGEDLAKQVESWNKSLTTWGLAGGVRTYTADPKDPNQLQTLVVEVLKAFALVPAAVPAAATK
jgi:poly(3-hydroxybutyrate) depolymerase